jgi:hypothetical protein
MFARTSVFSLIAASVLAGCSQQTQVEAPSAAAPATEAGAMLEMPFLMDHVLSTAAYKIWDASGIVNDQQQGEFELRPKTDEEWETVADGGAALAESYNMLMAPGRARDEMWRMYAQQLSDAGLEAFRAAEARDPQNTLFEIGSRIDAACTGCHVHTGIEQPAPQTAEQTAPPPAP